MGNSPMAKKADPIESAGAAAAPAANARAIEIVNNRLESRDLFVATKEITIGHEGEVYRLRLTALNKLILTK
jgi:hemin uptake protein HemP